MAPKGNTLSLEKKLQILAEIDKISKSGGKVNFASIARQFDVDKSTVPKIYKNQDAIKQQAKNGTLTLKRKRPFKEEDVDTALHMWLRQKLDQDARLNLPILKAKAVELAEHFGHEFIPSDSWLNRFKQRHGLKFKKEYGEKQAMDSTAAKEFQRFQVPFLMTRYEPVNIFNADETGLYFRGLPDRGYAHSHESLSGGKKAKDRVTALICANMTGTEKRRLLVIGKSKQPRHFPRDLNTLPVTYRNSKNAWMTSEIYTEYLTAWNDKLKTKDRKILLIQDNCSAHPSDLKFSHIEILFLPPNTTSAIQPMDMGVIHNLKAHYRSLLNRRIVQAMDMDQTKKAADAIKIITLLDAIFMLDKAWQSVSTSTIQNCYAKAGFKINIGDDEVEAEETVNAPVPVPENLTPEEFDHMVDQDKDLQICGTLSDTDLVNAVKKQKLEEEESDEDPDDEAKWEIKTPQLLESMLNIRTFLQSKGRASSLKKFEDIEEDIHRQINEQKKQKPITAFFKPKND